MNPANKLTLARIMLIPLFILFFAEYPVWLADSSVFIQFLNQYGTYMAVGVFVLASATDKLDGYIARKYHLITNLGKLLDPLADKLLVSVALIMMVDAGMVPAWMAFVMIGREFIVTALRMAASGRGIALAADRYGKWKMVSQVVAITVVLLNNYPFQWLTSLRVDSFLMVIAVMMTVLSGYHYVVKNTKLFM
ncbi:CDP-diacylglycerol--glycerol-3-phosphate 3-phosphatidyltransferase [Paenibacillus sp. XY044]|uniref:CDP-diacylglycerol--glycerol-3-phosphate 3-phosphatidyltransferase n=1 Tax=Paenibacillus sp. XY044 TaxID=2026089 RepID=UPI000B99146D|nr:CDP-diacylglycerol--glycerol-3-phosphate 3-phosphatidyltransferase [Paenibacillus sp. XY044]OZB96268.1 CDP-diacylglycerol--glycerol-3-phosphate 3-phosphatidyltransferase [Paenibacillus sp. XY044]